MFCVTFLNTKVKKCLKSKPLPKISFPPTDRCVIIIRYLDLHLTDMCKLISYKEAETLTESLQLSVFI